jgi:amidase
MGKTNVCTWLADFNADNPIYGRTNNPWNLDLTPGGSSGGSATLAAGLTALDLGSDLGGSLRIPAAFCGLWGHKPSAGIVPNTGHFPGSDRPNPAFPMAAQGLHARSVSDLEVGLNVITGPDADLETAWQLRLPAARHLRLKDFRVAVLPAMQWLPVDGEIVSALNTLCDGLRKAGAMVREIGPAGVGDLRDHYRIFRAMMGFTVSAHWPNAVRERMVAAKLARQEEFHAADAHGFAATAPQLAGWLGKCSLYRSAWREFFREWDILLTPMSLVPAFEHTRVPTADRRLQINGNAVEFDYMSFYPSVATLAGLPAVAFPAGKNKAGLPLGLQAIGPLLEDFTALRFAALIEDEFGSFKPPDGYDGDLT